MNNRTDAGEILLSGVSAAPGIVMGTVELYERQHPAVSVQKINDEEVEQHLKQFNEALSHAEQELNSLLKGQQNEDVAELLQAQIAMINDPDLRERVETEIKENKEPADAAIDKVLEVYLKLMDKNQQENTQKRSIDITDVRDQLIEILRHDKQHSIKDGAIIAAEELSPREVITFAKHKVQGIIMERGGETSHAAILARAMRIPTVVGLKDVFSAIQEGKPLILDGSRGEVVLNPSAETRKKYDEMAARAADDRMEHKKIIRRQSHTADGHEFTLRANIGFEEELPLLHNYDAKGIGLLRTESIFLNSDKPGSEQSQQRFYERVLQEAAPHPVTIRLFDAGGDKFFDLGQKEQNPFLGWRGIRMLLDEEETLRQQLRAILKAAVNYSGRVRILVPMVSSMEEVAAVKQILKQVQDKLLEEGYDIDADIKFGIMVEVPGTAMQISHFVHDVDFLSIGTNDLTQYLLAVDRGNERISDLYNQLHPSLWKLMKQIVDEAQSADIPVNVCGELASDPIGACGLVGLGVRELSMTPSALPEVKKILCDHTLDEMQQLAAAIVESATAKDVQKIITKF